MLLSVALISFHVVQGILACCSGTTGQNSNDRCPANRQTASNFRFGQPFCMELPSFCSPAQNYLRLNLTTKYGAKSTSIWIKEMPLLLLVRILAKTAGHSYCMRICTQREVCSYGYCHKPFCPSLFLFHSGYVLSFEPSSHGLPNVGFRLAYCFALTHATRQSRTFCNVPITFWIFPNINVQFHDHILFFHFSRDLLCPQY